MKLLSLKKVEKITFKKYCVVFKDIESEVLLYDCKHLCVCRDCLREIQKGSQLCPLCGIDVFKFKIIYKHQRIINFKKCFNRIISTNHSIFKSKQDKKNGYINI